MTEENREPIALDPEVLYLVIRDTLNTANVTDIAVTCSCHPDREPKHDTPESFAGKVTTLFLEMTGTPPLMAEIAAFAIHLMNKEN